MTDGYAQLSRVHLAAVLGEGVRVRSRGVHEFAEREREREREMHVPVWLDQVQVHVRYAS
jgi:hypothetical protein